MNPSSEPSTKYNIDILTGSITTVAGSHNAAVLGHPSNNHLELAGQMLPPESPDVPSSSKSMTGKAKPPGKVKMKEEVEKNSEEYLRRRQRNNVAVKKSREKSREKTVYTLQKVEQLKAENEQLETKISLLTKELSVLKDLFMDHAKGFCAGSGVDIMNPEQLETLLGCKVIRNREVSTTETVPGTTSTHSVNGASPMQPLLNAAESALRPCHSSTSITVLQESGESLPKSCNPLDLKNENL